MSFEAEWAKHPELTQPQMHELLRLQAKERLQAFIDRGYQTQEELNKATGRVMREYADATRKQNDNQEPKGPETI